MEKTILNSPRDEEAWDKGKQPAALNQAVPNPPLKCQKSQKRGRGGNSRTE